MTSFDLREIIEAFDLSIGSTSIAALAETIREDLAPDHPARSMRLRPWRWALFEAELQVWHHLPSQGRSRPRCEQFHDNLYRLHEPSVKCFLSKHRRYEIEVKPHQKMTNQAGEGTFCDWLDITKSDNSIIEEIRDADVGPLISSKSDLETLFPDALPDARKAWAAYVAWVKSRAAA